MARIRTIKPEFFTSEDIVALTMPARMLYVALWCEADRAGRLMWRPKTFKMRYFPADDLDIDALARELVASELVIRYGDDEELAYIPSFEKHQFINNREAASTLPEPPKNSTRGARVGHASGTGVHASCRKEGKESIGKEDNLDEYAADFLLFWNSCPTDFGAKGSKSDAAREFQKLKGTPTAEELAAAITAQAEHKRMQKRNGEKFIPPFKHVVRWLKGREWQTEVPTLQRRAAI